MSLGNAGDYLAVVAALSPPLQAAGLIPAGGFAALVDRDYAPEIAATFERIARPLRWPMEDFRRRKVRSPSFVGYRFSRVRRAASAGFAYGFALAPDDDLGIRAPPEAMIVASVRPVGSALYQELVTRPGSATRRLAASGRSMGYPFDLHLGEEAAAVRHRSFARHPPELFVIAAADFFMIAQRPLRVGGFVERVRKATTKPGP